MITLSVTGLADGQLGTLIKQLICLPDRNNEYADQRMT